MFEDILKNYLKKEICSVTESPLCIEIKSGILVNCLVKFTACESIAFLSWKSSLILSLIFQQVFFSQYQIDNCKFGVWTVLM